MLSREYWANNYQMVKMMNPRFPFILRDITEEGVDPYVIVKYGAVVCRFRPNPACF